jgi:hypothetical protein
MQKYSRIFERRESQLSLSYPKTRLSDIFLSESLKTKLDRILLEQRNAERRLQKRQKKL